MVVKWDDLLETLSDINGLIEKVVTEGVVHGSQSKVLSLNDFTWKTWKGEKYSTKPKVTDLMEDGMPILDAMVFNKYYSRVEREEIVVRPKEEKKHATPVAITRYLFMWYFSIFSQAKSEYAGTPAFLTGSMAFKDVSNKYHKNLTTANIDNFPFDWVKKMKMKDLGEKARNRFALGAAGHRYINSLKFLSAEDYNKDCEDGKEFFDILLGWTKGKLWWDLHPSFRATALIQVFGSLNHMIEDCLAVCIKESKLAQLASEKILNHSPKQHLRSRTWKDFTREILPDLREEIQ